MTHRCYVRVSSQRQADSGLGLEGQRTALAREIERQGWSDCEWYEDAAEGAGSLDRPELQRLLDDMRPGDTLAVSKLDRLSRSVADWGTLLERAVDEGWRIVSLDMPIDLTTPEGEYSGTIMFAHARLERRRIGDRTRDALAEAKKRGSLPGRRTRIPLPLLLRIEEMRESGMRMADVAEALNSEGILTVNDGPWYVSSVSGAMKSLRLEREAAAARGGAA